jgi:hypothetical protein
MKAKNRRWQCPNDKHPGILAPGRLRKNDIRRFCLECSKEAGVLVERTCPALDKRREERERVHRRKQQQRRAAARKAAVTRKENVLEKRRVWVGDVAIDLVEEARRLWNLPALVEAYAKLRDERPAPGFPHKAIPHSACMPTLNIRQSTRFHNGSRGRAWDRSPRLGRVSLTLDCEKNPVAALEVLLHELVHCAVGVHHHHDKVFRLTLITAAEQAWGVVQKPDLRRRVYATDHRLEIAMVDALAEGKLKLGRKKLPAFTSRELVALKEQRGDWVKR